MHVFCFFYAPGESHTEIERTSFYDDLRKVYERYPKDVSIFMIGDSNARLGKFSLDKDVNGKFKCNKNKPHFLGFLSFTAMSYVNGTYCRGIPTYEILGKKKSVIDVCLTNDMNLVHNFEVLSNILGKSNNSRLGDMTCS